MPLRHAALVAVLALTACAAPLKSFTDPEQARIDEYERAARQVLESRGIKGLPPAVRVTAEPALATMARPAAYFTPRTGRPSSVTSWPTSFWGTATAGARTTATSARSRRTWRAWSS